MQLSTEELEEKVAASETTPQRVDSLNKLAKSFLQKDPTQALVFASEAKKILLDTDLYALLKSKEKSLLKNPLRTAKSQLAYTHLILSEYALLNNNFEEAISQALRAHELYREISEKRGMADSYLKAGNAYTRSEKYEDALRYYQEVVQLYFGIGDNDELSSALINIAIVNFEISNYAEALRYVLQGIDLAQSSATQKFYPNGLNTAGNIFLHLGDYTRALEYFFKALEIHNRSELPNKKDSVHNNIATTYIYLNDYDKAIEHLKKSIDFAQQNRNLIMLKTALTNTGSVYFKLHEFETAHEYFQRAYQIAEELGHSTSISGILLNIGILFFEQGAYDIAIEYFGKSSAAENPVSAIIAERELFIARALHRTGSSEEAHEKFLRAFSNAEKIGEKPLIAECHRSLAEYYEESKNFEKAIAHLREFQALEKEIFNLENQRKLHSLQIAHEVEQAKQQAEIFRLRAEKLGLEKEFQQRRLTSMTLQLLSKNEAFSNVKKILSETKRSNSLTEIKANAETIERIANEQLRDASYWQSFEENFDQLHPEFTKKITEQGPDLTPTELRICTLIRSNLSSKQIANMLCVAEKTIEVHRTNIRRKLHLDPKSNLQSYIAQL